MSTLLRWLLLRRLALQRGRTLLTALGVALGVAVFVAVRLANRSALASFADTVDAVTGRANLVVRAAGDGFDERLYARLVLTPGIEAAAPVVQASALVRPGGPRPAGGSLPAGETGPYRDVLMFLGIDPLVEAPFVRFDEAAAAELGAAAAPGGREGALRLLAEPGTVAITGAYAARTGLAAGDSLTALVSGRAVPLRIAQVLRGAALQQAMGGNVALMDVATAQEVFGRAGRLDRVDLIVAPAARARVAKALAAALPAGVVAETPQARTSQVEDMVAAFSLNLSALSFIAVLVSTFLVFNAVAMSVLRWRRDIGILRGLGATRGQVVRLFLAEGALLGGVGSALGVVFGTLLARGTLRAVGRTLTDLYLVRQAGSVRLDAATLAEGFALGLGAALLSALAPAFEAAATPPAETMRQGMLLEARRLPVGRLALGGLATLALAGAVVAWTVTAGRPWGGFVAAFLVVAAFALAAPAFTLAGEALLRGPAAAAGISASLGVRALRDFVARTSAVVAALMLAVGMTVALTIMVGSFRRTVDTWVTQTIRGDLYVEPVGHRAAGSATALPDSLVAAAAALPGVRAVDTYRATPLLFRGRTVNAIGVDFAVQRDFGHLAFTDGADPRALLRGALADGAVIVSESFARRFRVRPGEPLALPAPGGAVPRRVAGVFYDYSTDAGVVMMDRASFAALWGERTESMALYCAPGADLEVVRRAFVARAGAGRLFHVTPNQELRRRVLAVFDQTFRITFALQFIAVAVAVLGVVTTLTALILQRGREIGVLRATGATRGQVRGMVLAEGAVLGLLGGVLGCAAGTVLALLLVHVINRQYFGWTIRLAVDPGVYAQAVALMVITALAASIGPARFAADRVAAEAMRVEG